MPNSVLSTGKATGNIAMALVFKSGSNTLNGNIATASDSCAMFRIMVMDSQAIEGTVFGPGREEFSSSVASLTNSLKNPVGKREVLTKG